MLGLSQQSDLNRRPSDYKSDALPLCYAGTATIRTWQKPRIVLKHHTSFISYHNSAPCQPLKAKKHIRPNSAKRYLIVARLVIFQPQGGVVGTKSMMNSKEISDLNH